MDVIEFSTEVMKLAAYVIVDAEALDDALYADVIERSPAITEAHGGKYLVRGGIGQTFVGNRPPHFVVIVEFENMDRLLAWQRDLVAAGLIDEIERSANAIGIIVEGV